MDEFSDKKQKLLIEYLISSLDIFATCVPIIQASYFEPRLRGAVGFIKKYYEEFNNIPNTDQIEAETKTILEIKEITQDQHDYCCSEIERFCRYKALEKVILNAPDLMDNGEYGKILKQAEDAISTSLNKDLGVRYFENRKQRLIEAMNSGDVEPTGWNDLDKELEGGIARKEMILFAGNSGCGKSVTLANLGFNFVQRKLNVLYITLELATPVVEQRYDMMVTGKGSRGTFKSHINEIGDKVEEAGKKCGILDIVHMSSGTKALEIRAYLNNYKLKYKMLPDLLILDYVDKMSSNEYVSADNAWEKDKRCSEQLRDVGVDYNMFIATASQLNRGAVGAAEHTHAHIAGGISKINETDIYISLVLVKHQGQIFFQLQKTRNSSGLEERFIKNWDPNRLRITDIEGPGDNQSINTSPKTK